MKKILFPLLFVAFGAQAQQFERYAPTNPNWNPQCTHRTVMVYDLNKKYSHTANFEFCPGWEQLQEKMVCILPDGKKENLRCYHSAYGRDEYILGKQTLACMLRSYIRSAQTLTLFCTEAKLAEVWLREFGRIP